MTPVEVVHAFLAAMEARDYATSLPLLTDDVEYQNMPLPAVHGRAAVRDLVMNERTDRFELSGAWVDLPVAGVFVVREEQISLWRDYFDLTTIMDAMV